MKPTKTSQVSVKKIDINFLNKNDINFPYMLESKLQETQKEKKPKSKLRVSGTSAYTVRALLHSKPSSTSNDLVTFDIKELGTLKVYLSCLHDAPLEDLSFLHVAPPSDPSCLQVCLAHTSPWLSSQKLACTHTTRRDLVQPRCWMAACNLMAILMHARWRSSCKQRNT